MSEERTKRRRFDVAWVPPERRTAVLRAFQHDRLRDSVSARERSTWLDVLKVFSKYQPFSVSVVIPANNWPFAARLMKHRKDNAHPRFFAHRTLLSVPHYRTDKPPTDWVFAHVAFFDEAALFI